MASNIEVFLCYALQDEGVLEGLERQLRILTRQNIINVWSKRYILPGGEREYEIEKHLKTAHIILLLISPSFMDSEYCYGQEMMRAIERHDRGEARVIPILLSPVYYGGAPFRGLQVLPRDGRPLIKWRSRDEAFYVVTMGILETVEDLKNKRRLQAGEKQQQESLDSLSLLGQPTAQDTYRKFWERRFRGLLVFLLDQSGSMLQELQIAGKTYTNGQMATAAINESIYNITNNIWPEPATGRLKDLADILVLGYGDRVMPLLHDGNGKPVSISELMMRTPKGYESVQVGRMVNGRIIQVQEKRPYWIESYANSDYTEMAQALQTAHQTIIDWLEADKIRFRSFPPLVINITDGGYSGKGDPVVAAANLRQLSTYDGHVLLFNCHLTSGGRQHIVFPQNLQAINQIGDPGEREWARQLFSMSSIIPKTIIRRAQNLYRMTLEEQARGFLYNASPGDLMNFLRWGTQPNG